MKKLLILLVLVAVSAGFYIASAQTTVPIAAQASIRTVEIESGAKTFTLPAFSEAKNAEKYSLSAMIDGKKVLLKSDQIRPFFENIDASLFKFGTNYEFIVTAGNKFGVTDSRFIFSITEKRKSEKEFSLNDALKLDLIQSIYKEIYLKSSGVGSEAFVAALDVAMAEALKTIQGQTRNEINESDAAQIFKDLSSNEVRLLLDIKMKERTGEKVVYIPDNARVVPELSIYNPVAVRPTIAKRFAAFFSTFILRRPALVEEVLTPETRVTGTTNALARIQENRERFSMLEKEGFMYPQGLIQAAQELETKGSTSSEKAAYKAAALSLNEMSKWGFEVGNFEKDFYSIISATKDFIITNKGKKFNDEALIKAVDEIYEARKEQYETNYEEKYGFQSRRGDDQVLGGKGGPINIDPGSLTPVCFSNSQPWIKVTSPNGGEAYTAGQLITVTWKSCKIPNVPTNPQVSIKLVHSLNWTYPTNYTQVTAAPNTSVGGGSATFALPDSSWFVPGAFQSGSNYKIQVSDYTNSSVLDTSDNLFTIN